MVLSFYKFILKKAIVQTIIKLNLRKRCQIGESTYISKNSRIGKSCSIRDNVFMGENVTLFDGVLIGNNASITNIEVGNNSQIEAGVICTGLGEGKIMIGKECYVGIYNILDWSDNITIGDFVHIAGPSTGLWTHSSALMCLHGVSLKNPDKKYRPTAPIVIESNVYIGCNCTIYPGVIIGHHAIVTPNSVVTKDVEPYTMVGGVPAKVIKKLKI